MSAAALLPRVLWGLAVLVVALVCGGAGPAHARGDWSWPLQPAPPVARPFDPPEREWAAGHRGVDLRGHAGQPVLSPAGGRVAFAADLAGRGVVVVEIDGLRATFEPVAPAVTVGDRVRAGDVIGHLQATQSHCLPAACLHWGVKHGDGSRPAYVDPLSFVGSADIVLLPFLDRSAREGSGAHAAAGPGPPDRYGPPSRPASAPSGAAATAVRFALAQLGDPYVWAAAGPHSWDCSGLTMAAWEAVGRDLPHYSAAQYLQTTPVTADELRPGDLVFWSGGGPAAIYHVALYLGDGQVVHAPRPGTSVRIEGMRSWAEPDYFGRP